MIRSKEVKVYGGSSKNGVGATSVGTPKDIDPAFAPSITLISGQAGSGKSVIAANLIQHYAAAHAAVGSKPRLLIYSGASGDPAFSHLPDSSERVKKFDSKTLQQFVDTLNTVYDDAMTSKKQSGGSGEGEEGGGGDDTASGAMKHLQERSVAASAATEERKHRPTLVVIDDHASSGLIPSVMGRSPIARPLQSFRHSDLNFIIMSQRYSGHNPWLRSNASYIYVSPPSGESELATLRQELPVARATLDRGFSTAVQRGPHNFIGIDVKKREARHNFSDELI